MRLRLFVVAVALASIMVMKSVAHAGSHSNEKPKQDLSKLRSRSIASVPKGRGMLEDKSIRPHVKDEKSFSKPLVEQDNPFLVGKARPF